MSDRQRLAALLGRLERRGIRLGLDSMRRLLGALGDPQEAFASVLVAGTNGKGSTAALLAAMAGAAGYRTGLYTSPHLERVEERVRVDGRAVPTAELLAALLEVERAAERRGGGLPTYFEALTAAAFLLFRGAGIDLAVLEVGLGGRLDATNTVEPRLSLISQIGLEHQAYLGSTLTEIAREKAGVLRAGRPALAWVEEPEAEREIRRRARELGAELAFAWEHLDVEARESHDATGQRVRLRTVRSSYDVEMALVGEHQVRNLALAVRGAEALAADGWERIGPAAIRAGAASCRWPARLERIGLPGSGDVLLDAAHNPAGAATLARFLERRAEPYALVFGALSDKDVSKVLPPLAAAAAAVVFTRPPSPRALDPASLVELAPGGGARVVAAPGAALESALEISPGLVVACGSIYLVGALREWLRERFGVPPPAVEVPTYGAPPARQERGAGEPAVS